MGRSFHGEAPKNKKFVMRVTEKDFDEIEEYANKSEMTKSEFVSNAIKMALWEHKRNEDSKSSTMCIEVSVKDLSMLEEISKSIGRNKRIIAKNIFSNAIEDGYFLYKVGILAPLAKGFDLYDEWRAKRRKDVELEFKNIAQ
jgi:hypothetical protein